MRGRIGRFLLLWRAASTGRDLGLTGPAVDVVLTPSPRRTYWLDALATAETPEERRRKAHGYVLKVLEEAELRAAETADDDLSRVVAEAHDYLVGHDLIVASRIEQALRTRALDTDSDSRPAERQQDKSDLVDLDTMQNE